MIPFSSTPGTLGRSWCAGRRSSHHALEGRLGHLHERGHRHAVHAGRLQAGDEVGDLVVDGFRARGDGEGDGGAQGGAAEGGGDGGGDGGAVQGHHVGVQLKMNAKSH